jgi:phosphoribosyl 1,2-cyclic phosphate phosphodiesterase
VKESINDVDAIFLTHWHADHYSGLGEFEYYVKLLTKEPLDLYLPESAVDDFVSTFPDLSDVFRVIPWQFQKKYVFGDISLTPLKANHGIETAGFLVESNEMRLAYFPDTAGLPAETAGQLKDIEYLICDATFYGENWYPHSHMNVDQAIALGRAINARQIVLTHLSIHYSQPVTTTQLEKELLKDQDVMLAYDGMTIELIK